MNEKLYELSLSAVVGEAEINGNYGFIGSYLHTIVMMASHGGLLFRKKIIV